MKWAPEPLDFAFLFCFVLFDFLFYWGRSSLFSSNWPNLRSWCVPQSRLKSFNYAEHTSKIHQFLRFWKTPLVLEGTSLKPRV